MIRKEHISGKCILVHCPGHLEANSNGFVYEHRLIAEKALGKLLPPGVEIHHVDGDGTNNSNSNLVICQDKEYHALLHARTRARTACGNPNWRKCRYCGKYDDLANLLSYTRSYYQHRTCHSASVQAHRLTHGRSR